MSTSFFTTPRLIQIGIGAGGIIGGCILGSKVVGSAFERDLTAPPSRIVATADGWIVDQPNKPKGPFLTNAFMGGGALVAGLGAAMTMGHIPLFKPGSMARAGVGALMFAGGVGIVAGAIAASMQWTGTAIRQA